MHFSCFVLETFFAGPPGPPGPPGPEGSAGWFDKLDASEIVCLSVTKFMVLFREYRRSQVKIRIRIFIF